jgi:hypothetical protein
LFRNLREEYRIAAEEEEEGEESLGRAGIEPTT